MALIQVTPDLLRQKANEVRQYRGEHEEVMNKFKTLMYALDEIWKGEAQAAIIQRYEAMQPTFQNFVTMLEDYAKLMDASANSLEEVDQQLKQQISSQ